MTGRIARITFASTLLLGAVLLTGPLSAHEYWFDPVDATPAADETLRVHVRNGVDFAGSSYPYNPRRMSRLDLVGPDEQSLALSQRLGDVPAVQTSLTGAGHYLLVLDTYGKSIVYDDLAAFEKFLRYHSLEAILAEHQAQGLPGDSIREIYFRHVKTLVRAGDARVESAESGGAFSAHGQRLELVPLTDPYASDELRLRLLFKGEPLAGAQVELFERDRAGGSVSRLERLTDARGDVAFDVARSGDYLVNAVQVLAPEAEALAVRGPEPHWESRWSSLTFERP